MDVDLGPVVTSLLLLILLVFVGGRQVSSEPCEVNQIYCPDRPGNCCDPPEHPWQPQAPPLPQAPLSPPRNTNPQALPPPQSPPLYPHVLLLQTNWYFWVLVVALVLSCTAGCGYWRRRKIYESSASQTLGHAHANGTPTPSDDTPMYGPPLPFLPPTPYPAPPPYSEAARPSYDPLEQHLYDAMLAGRSVYDFYDRRHPNAYYDRYFLPDDTSSSETTSLLSYRLHRSCSAHLPRHHSLRKCDMLAPPPYSEVAAKPELYPVVVVRGGMPEVKSTKSMTEGGHVTHTSAHWPAPCHHYIYRSGSVSTPEGSQSSSYTCGATLQSDYGRCRVSSPGCVLALASPASSVGPHNSDVSSLPPTSPPSPPAPTSPTLPPSPATRELRDVLQKISQLPGAASPPPLTPGPSPLSPCCPPHYRPPDDALHRMDRSLRRPYSPPPRQRARRPLGASLSLDVTAPTRPRSLPLTAVTPSSPPCLNDPPSPLLPASTSTPNLAAAWPSPPGRTVLVAALVDGERVVQRPERGAEHLAPGEGDGEWGRDASDRRFRWRARDRSAERV
ncbi:proline-rich protein 36-like isoform X2 [Penaeus japonicus]|uniref:proline-rich protein 36-like isoform X2 n=1 Tax=Penaeus japonicus TaxID=27405 RepID=UPI001C717237|nr:proline-rich protein 36-like isoform X2 [Penaeus japonicus]